jgi:hypothetical protein
MALIGKLAVLGTSLLVAVLSRLFVDEFEAWSPTLICLLLRTAVVKLPQDLREKFAEEWNAHIGEVPGKIGKILAAVGFVLAAYRISHMRKERLGFRARVFIFCLRQWFLGHNPPLVNELLHRFLWPKSELMGRVLWRRRTWQRVLAVVQEGEDFHLLVQVQEDSQKKSHLLPRRDHQN